MCGILLCVHRNDNTSYLKEKYFLMEKKYFNGIRMHAFFSKQRISYEFVNTTMCTKSVKIIVRKTKHWNVCICRVQNFPRLVIRPLPMRHLINMKSIISNWELSHHSRKYYSLLHILPQKVFSTVLRKVLLLDLWSLNGRRLVLSSSTQKIYTRFLLNSVPSMAKYSTLLGLCHIFNRACRNND